MKGKCKKEKRRYLLRLETDLFHSNLVPFSFSSSSSSSSRFPSLSLSSMPFMAARRLSGSAAATTARRSGGSVVRRAAAAMRASPAIRAPRLRGPFVSFHLLVLHLLLRSVSLSLRAWSAASFVAFSMDTQGGRTKNLCWISRERGIVFIACAARTLVISRPCSPFSPPKTRTG